MKITKFKILTIIAVLNSILLGVTAFLTVFMFKNNISEFDTFSRLIIPICLIGSLLTKFRISNKLILGTSGLFDLILIFYIYNPTDSESISAYFKGIIDPNALSLSLLYAYLLFFYLLAFKKSI